MKKISFFTCKFLKIQKLYYNFIHLLCKNHGDKGWKGDRERAFSAKNQESSIDFFDGFVRIGSVQNRLFTIQFLTSVLDKLLVE